MIVVFGDRKGRSCSLAAKREMTLVDKGMLVKRSIRIAQEQCSVQHEHSSSSDGWWHGTWTHMSMVWNDRCNFNLNPDSSMHAQ